MPPQPESPLCWRDRALLALSVHRPPRVLARHPRAAKLQATISRFGAISIDQVLIGELLHSRERLGLRAEDRAPRDSLDYYLQRRKLACALAAARLQENTDTCLLEWFALDAAGVRRAATELGLNLLAIAARPGNGPNKELAPAVNHAHARVVSARGFDAAPRVLGRSALAALFAQLGPTVRQVCMVTARSNLSQVLEREIPLEVREPASLRSLEELAAHLVVRQQR